MTTQRQLFDLQEVDSELDRVLGQIATLTKRIQDDVAIVAARQGVAKRRENIQQMRLLQAKRTQDVHELQQKAREVDERLYGGAVRSIKEMDALQNEVSGLRGQARSIEDDELLSVMMKLEEEEALAVKESAGLVKLEQERLSLIQQLTSERSKLEAALPGLKAKRQEAAAAFPAVLLSQYQRLRSAKQGKAVVKVERDMCGGCRLMLPQRELQQARLAKEPIFCPSCGRILVAG